MTRIRRLTALLLAASFLGTVGAAGQTSAKVLSQGWQGPEAKSFPLPQDGSRIAITGRVGKVGGQIDVFFGNARKGMLLRVTGMDTPKGNQHWGTTQIPEDAGLKDGALRLALSGVGIKAPRLRQDYYVRPDIHFYIGEDFTKAVAKWKSHTPASQHDFGLEARRIGKALELWVDGRYLTRLDVRDGWTEVKVTPAAEARIGQVAGSADPESERFLPLDLSRQRHQGETTLTGLALSNNFAPPKQVPLGPVALDKQVDVGLARWLRQSKDSFSFYDPFYKRTAWDSLPESILFRVPRRFYQTAHILCAVDPERSPTMAVRIGRYRQKWDGSGMTQGTTNVRLDPAAPEGVLAIERVGSVQLGQPGKTREAPVYRIAVPLRLGEVAGYLQWKGTYDGRGDWGAALDFFTLEFTRAMRRRVAVNSGIFETKPLGAQSGVHILAVTLEKAPVEIMITSAEPGFSFYIDQQPALTIKTVNHGAKAVQLGLTATLTNFGGARKIVSKTISAPPGEGAAPFDLSALDPGWYEGDFVFRDAAGKVIWQRPLTFALLPPDTRQAGRESPFGTWWFKGSHYTEPHADNVLPIIQKMGFRHVTPPSTKDKRNAARGITPESFARYGITPSMLGRVRRSNIEGQIKSFFEQWPETEFAMIFHETGIAGMSLDLPYELTGAAPTELPETDDKRGGQARVAELLKHATERAQLIRQASPKTRIMLGNSSTKFNVFWLRQKLPRDVWDCIGMEMAVQTLHPEGQPTGWNLQSLWIAKRMREIYGYDDMPIASCYEFDYRSTAPGGLSLERQANWYARDVLHCLAYRMPSINVALIADCNSSYYTSRWGATGVCFRAPLQMPKPSFVTLATLTRVLDRAEYQRYLDTGSTGLYCLEFKRADSYVYAIWAGRGRRPVALALEAGAGKFTLIDGMGKETPLTRDGNSVKLTATESPCYLVSPAKVAKVTLGQPEHPAPALEGVAVLAPMAQATKWRVAPGADEAFENYCAYKPMVKGDVGLTNGSDKSIRLTLTPQPKTAGIIGRYAVLDPIDGPIPMPGKPGRVGVWVNGNSNWGRVYFEFADAKGRRWTSNGWAEAPRSWDMSDWEADTAVNHDGWRFIEVPLPALYASGYYTPTFRHWRCQGDSSKDNQPAYPLKFARLYVVMREKLVYVTDMKPAASMSIELRGLAVAAGDGK